MYKLILNTKFCTLNEYIKAERTNKYISAKIKKEQTNKVYYLAIEQKFKLPANTKFDVQILWLIPNKKPDPDNISFAKKFVLDGLVNAKILENDSLKFINSFSDSFEVDKTKPYISCVVTFRPVELKEKQINHFEVNC